jgi:exosortase E/protease (VPEID-CTERM system)
VLLLVEAMIISQHFDTSPLVGDGRWWADVIAGSKEAARTALAAAAATVLLGVALRRDAFRGPLGRLRAPHRAWPFLLLHLAAFAGFFALSSVILDRDVLSSNGSSGWLVVAWCVVGLAVALTWAAAVVPPRDWLPIAGAAGFTPWAGLAIGTVATQGSRVASEVLWDSLSRSTLMTVHGMLRLVYAETVCDPKRNLVGTPTYAVSVAPQCSGYEGIGLILVFLVVFLYLYRRDYRFPHALYILPLGAVIIWLANAARIALLVAVGTSGARAVAEGGFHSLAGWLAFDAVGLGLVVATRRVRFLAAPGRVPSPSARVSNPVAVFLMPLLVLLAATMITGAVSSGFDRLYPVRVFATSAALLCISRAPLGLRWTWSWLAVMLGVGVFLIWMALELAAGLDPGGESLAAGLARLSERESFAWLFFRVIGSVLTVPLAEELAFRGYATRRLIASDFLAVPPGQFSWVSFLGSSALFGALHGRYVAGMLAGMLYALAYYRRGELTDCVIAHATTNALIAITVLSTGSWSLWA